MNMTKSCIVSPCGTSLLTNGTDNDMRRLLTKHANAAHLTDIPADDRIHLKYRVEQVRKEALKLSPADIVHKSAELNAIVKFYHGKLQPGPDFHLLVCTDTWLGEQTASIIQQWLAQHDQTVDIRKQTDLQTAELAAFQLALSDMVGFFSQTLPAYKQQQYKIVFNLTGGFKSVQGFLQTLAMFYADEVVYVFESGLDLLKIPRIPVRLSSIDVIRSHTGFFRNLARGIPVHPGTEALHDIPETLLMTIGDDITLSPWGTLVWEEARKPIYAEGLLPPDCDRLRFTRKFRDKIEALDGERTKIINERMDQLARHLADETFHPRSLGFKQLKVPRTPATHELYAWSDKDARRIFGHFEDRRFVIDDLNEHL
jgi:putative CRISPR-associated protein (TIGR02619 family)